MASGESGRSRDRARHTPFSFARSTEREGDARARNRKLCSVSQRICTDVRSAPEFSATLQIRMAVKRAIVDYVRSNGSDIEIVTNYFYRKKKDIYTQNQE